MEDQNEGRHFHPLPDPAERPVEQAAQALAKCALPIDNPDKRDTMLRELRASIAEFNPNGIFRTADTRLASQSALLDEMFYLSAMEAIGAFKREDGAEHIYLRPAETILTLKIQNQYRRTIEGMKTDSRDVERINIARERLHLQARRRNS